MILLGNYSQYKKYLFLVLSFLIPLNSSIYGNAFAQSDSQKELKRLELEQATRQKRVTILESNAKQANDEISQLRQRLINAAQERDLLEKRAESSFTSLINLRKQEKNATNSLMERREALEDVIVALIAVERDRPPALAVRPTNATEAARVAIIMRLVAPGLDSRTRSIANEIKQLKQVRENILMSNVEYRNATIKLTNARKNVGILIAERQRLIAKLNQDAQNEKNVINSISVQASNLRELIGSLGNNAASKNEPVFSSNFADYKGKLIRPVNGIIVKGYGARLDEGGNATGITFRSRQASQVVSPFDGRIEFAAPFRSYGKLLIINVGSGYRIIVAGLGATYVEAGQDVLAGEPIGEMTNLSQANNELYFEIRKNETTLDPALWLQKISNNINANISSK